MSVLQGAYTGATGFLSTVSEVQGNVFECSQRWYAFSMPSAPRKRRMQCPKLGPAGRARNALSGQACHLCSLTNPPFFPYGAACYSIARPHVVHGTEGMVNGVQGVLGSVDELSSASSVGWRLPPPVILQSETRPGCVFVCVDGDSLSLRSAGT